MYKNLVAELICRGISAVELAKVLGCSVQTAINKVLGEEVLYAEDVYYIKETFFPNESYDYLFKKEIE